MERSLSDYLSLSRELDFDEFDTKIKIGFLSSFTINGLSEILKIKCHEKKISCQAYMGPYKQFNQEILDSNSQLYKFQPNVTFLLLDIRSIFNDFFYSPYEFDPAQRKEYVQKKIDELKNLASFFTKTSKSKLIISNLSVPYYSPYGIAESNSEFGLYDMVLSFNNLLKDFIKNFDSVFLFDFNSFVMRFGEENIFNFQNYFFGDIKIGLNYLPNFGESLMSYVIAYLGITKKCIVLDLDNTLWGGIVGEDGFDGISLGPQPPGNVFYEFQRFLKGLTSRGILLAINSKNNFEDAIKVIREHPFMVLKENDFSCMVINWGDKAQNLRDIAKKLNIGIDSMVFFDDDPINREYVKKELPQVTVPELSADPAENIHTLMSLNDFSLFEITKEDTKRNEMYVQQQKRIELEQSSSNLEDFLKTLDIHVVVEKANDFTIPRISQLTLKTNQFNLTTKRYQKEDIEKFSHSDDFIIISVKVNDKFGDSGITGVCIAKKENQNIWFIDTFLLSCRIMGREIEKVMLNYVIEEAKKNNVKIIRAKFIPTEKNSPIADFLPSCGFEKTDDFWEFDVEKSFKNPEFITVEET